MKASGCIWNALTVFFIALSLLACVWAGAVFMNPGGPFNPLKPPILDGGAVSPVPDVAATPTPVDLFPTLPPEWTATFTPQPTPATPTETVEPTETDTPEPTVTVIGSPVGPTATQSETPIPTRTPTATRPVIQPTATRPPANYPPPTPPTAYP